MQATQTVSHPHDTATPPPVRRIVTLDIETASLYPADPKGALDALTGRIVCAGLLFDDGERLTPNPICETDERKLLERFWAALRPDGLIVGYNVLAFDLMFIRQRSWILGVKPPIALNLKKYYTDQVVDLMELWTNWSAKFKGCGLDNIARALGLGAQKTGSGADVAVWWANRDYDSIVRYCMADVELTYRVYCRMHYREPLDGAPQIQVEQPAVRVVRPVASLPLRELVPVPVRPAASANGIPRAVIPPLPEQHVRVEGFAPAAKDAPATASPRSGRLGGPRKRQDKICYAEMGGALLLTGATFGVKDELAALGGLRTKNGEQWIWQVPARQFDQLAGLCARHSVQLIPAA